MKFCELARFMHQNFAENATAGEFMAILIDAILDDEGPEEDFTNPMYNLSQSTREAYYSGRLPISQRKAAIISPRVNEERFAEFVNTCSMDALDHMWDKLVEFGVEVQAWR